MVEDLLDVSRLESGSLRVDRRLNHARELVETAAALASVIADASNVVLDVELPDANLVLLCDRRRLLQALSNMLGNAMKFTPAQGHIAFRCTADAERVTFTIADEGPGIADEHAERIFDPFWRGEHVGDGLGLGLSIAKAITLAHGGSLTVKNDRGAVFVLTLPA